MVVSNLQEIPDDFHATLDATGKEYLYRLSLGPVQLPQERLYSWHIPYRLDWGAMRKAAEALRGEHDFSAFANQDGEARDPLCRVEEITMEESGRFLVRGNRFLYKMVRTIVGTLIDVGRERIAAEELPAILASRRRERAGVTAPAHGLTLRRVYYDRKE